MGKKKEVVLPDVGAQIKQSETVAEESIVSYKEETDREQKQKRQKPTKSNSDYLRLDLIPSDETSPYYGIDFKEYVIERAKEESKYKEPVSATRYIQNLIFADMQGNTKIQLKSDTQRLFERLGKHKKVIEQFSELSEQDRRTVANIIDALLIRAKQK